MYYHIYHFLVFIEAMSNEGLARSEDVKAVEVSISIENMAEAMCVSMMQTHLIIMIKYGNVHYYRNASYKGH